MKNVTDHIEHMRSLCVGALADTQLESLNDDELLGATAALESLGRVVDALRIGAAGEVADRSRADLAGERLSARKGCRSATELLERVTQISGGEARRRTRVGTATRTSFSLSGETVQSPFAHVAAGLAAGALGIDSAHIIVRELERPRRVASAAASESAEAALVSEATGSSSTGSFVRCSADEVRVQAQAWAAFLDQDGPEPDDERAMRRRGFRVARARDGLISVSGELLPEVAGALTRLFDAHLAPRAGSGFLTEAERADPATSAETRTPDQQRHDVLASIIDSSARSATHPTIGGAAPTVLVSVRASDLENGRGSAHVDGIDAPASLRAARRLMCTGGIQTVAVDDIGAIIELGSPERCFTPHQRRAITLRDGGCLIPGCSVPASWCEIHHVTPARDGGPTHPDNGVLLCWFHHRTIDTSGWGIRMMRGSPHVQSPAWLDPGGTWQHSTKSPTQLADRLDAA